VYPPGWQARAFTMESNNDDITIQEETTVICAHTSISSRMNARLGTIR
jgi:hypothetical protein